MLSFDYLHILLLFHHIFQASVYLDLNNDFVWVSGIHLAQCWHGCALSCTTLSNVCLFFCLLDLSISSLSSFPLCYCTHSSRPLFVCKWGSQTAMYRILPIVLVCTWSRLLLVPDVHVEVLAGYYLVQVGFWCRIQMSSCSSWLLGPNV